MSGIGPSHSHGRFRYGSWRGGPDPLAPPYDVRAAVDQIGADLLSAGNLRDSLRELLRRGTGRSRRARQAGRADPAAARSRPGGAATSAAPSTRSGPRWTRRWPPSGRPWPGLDGDDARFAEMELDTLPDDVAGAVRALEPYPWRSPEAQATYEAIKRHAAARGAGRPVRRDEAGSGVPGSRGDAAGQGHAGRPERAARRARPQRGHHRRLRATSWPSTASSFPSSRRPSRS